MFGTTKSSLWQMCSYCVKLGTSTVYMCVHVRRYIVVVYDVWSRDMSDIRTHLFPLSIRPFRGVQNNIHVLLSSLSIRPCVGIIQGRPKRYTRTFVFISVSSEYTTCVWGVDLYVVYFNEYYCFCVWISCTICDSDCFNAYLTISNYTVILFLFYMYVYEISLEKSNF